MFNMIKEPFNLSIEFCRTGKLRLQVCFQNWGDGNHPRTKDQDLALSLPHIKNALVMYALT